jgi:nitroreductase
MVEPPQARRPVASDTVGLLDGLLTTRAIRRYTDDDVPDEAMRDILFAATRAPSGSNRQPTRYIVLRDGPRAREARRLIGESARRVWRVKHERDGYDTGSGLDTASAKTRMARTMNQYVEHFESVAVVVLVCHLRYRRPVTNEGGNVYPACQNLLLAARALGYGGVITGFHGPVEAELHELLGIPKHAFIAATITLGRPAGHHGPVRRRPLAEVIFEDAWGEAAGWAVDPPGTRHTAAGPPTTWANAADQQLDGRNG